MNKFDAAYAAGYIDGDGCFFIGKSNTKNKITPKYNVSINISSVNIEVLKVFKDQFGGSIFSQKAILDHKPLHYLTIRKQNSLNLCDLIKIYIVEKKEELSIFQQFANVQDIKEKERLFLDIRLKKDSCNLVSKHHKDIFTPSKSTINPSEEDYAYLAGFIDAECCLGISKYKPKNNPNYTYKIMLQLNNTKAPVFKWLLERFGGHINFINRISKGYGRRNQLCWRLSGNALSKILHKIHPFIKHKKPVLEKLIEFYNTTLKNGGARHTEEFRSSYAEVINKREDIVKTIHLLNLKGNSKH